MDFVILKVNGQDLSGASHEEAVEAFRLAKEPIVVEVLRRAAATLTGNNNVNMNNNRNGQCEEVPTSTIQSKSVSPSPSLADATTQTDWTGDAPVPNGVFGSPVITKLDVEQEADPVFEGEIDDSFDDPRNYDDIEYEEVTLLSSDNQDKLGLTLCCGGGEDDGAIFVSEIAPCGIAAQDGRIQEGDQILQVNGVDVVSREQVVNLFGQGKSEITIVVARPHSQDELYLDESYLLEHHPLLQIPQEEDEDNLVLICEGDSGNGQRHDKDSGVGRTEDGSTCNGESSEGPCSPLPPSAGADGEKEETAVDDEEEEEEILSPSTEERLTTPDKKGDAGDSEGSSIERELALLNQEMTQIQIECQNIVRAHANASSQLPEDSHLYCNLPIIPPALPSKSSTISAAHKPCPVDKAEAVEEWVKSTNLMNQGKTGGTDWETSGTSSSAYNTGDSCRSTPLTLELHVQDKSTQLNADSDAYSVYSCESCRRCLHLPPPPPTQPPPIPANSSQPSTGKRSKNSNKGNGCVNAKVACETEKNQNYVTFVPPSPSRAMANTPPTSTMYTNEANLEHTIWLQQQLFRQSLLQKQQHGSSKKLSCPSSLSTPARKIMEPPTCNSATTPMEWKVKRRTDGTRYITRRPVRNRLLKERANRLNEERGLTTDDDNASELKWGRYWSKEDRKRHLERAKDHKRKREMILRMRSAIQEAAHGGTLPGQGAGDGIVAHGPNNNPILELSHKKMMRKKGMTLFDDFTTVQEVLAHGTRGSSQGSTKTMGLLSVTTV